MIKPNPAFFKKIFVPETSQDHNKFLIFLIFTNFIAFCITFFMFIASYIPLEGFSHIFEDVVKLTIQLLKFILFPKRNLQRISIFCFAKFHS